MSRLPCAGPIDELTRLALRARDGDRVALATRARRPPPTQRPTTAAPSPWTPGWLRSSRTAGAAFVLTQLLGLLYAEAAVVCGVPMGTIRSRAARAREQLLAAEAADGRSQKGGA